MASSNVPAGIAWPVQFCVFITLSTYVASLITSNVSHVDRLWTFLPTIYTAYYALLPLWPHSQPFYLFPYAPKALGHDIFRDFSPRAVLMLSLVVLWMFRLSYNTWRRGLFSLSDEDYRWAVLRTKVPPWFFQVVNISFIAITQNILLLMLALPSASAAILQPHDALSAFDYLLAGFALIVLGIEFTADNQQFAYHSYKHAYLAREKGSKSVQPYDANKQWPGSRLNWTPADAKRGFITRGLWAWSRHPNFACEQTFWWIITLFPLLARSPPNLPSPSPDMLLKAITHPSSHLKPLILHWFPEILHLIPAASLSLLFFSSTLFTESISKNKYYEAYSAYQQRVGMFLPKGTVEKALFIKLFKSDQEARRIDNLVWGNVENVKKMQ
ncbi:hypothetical protein AMATHDRAFT_138180 [Amanita thiersii Skay4041]|uniref:DUF1295-domain-containing protein n=1 Tax=Amanita thiersii Skay4041 TaxID=703135 RepID=A0A2A9NYP1_9AGAR|nr:hypothetical protein AMATHDRAFT_138180 [Amanita thiersii Skay4041]